ncbi:Uncharacterized protein Rs2_25328 [Raphanus sativus]|nr:Uncharacterized protein Rs2_25328 [Raphanus sativus]
MPGSIYIFEGRKYEVVLNNHNTRPFCSQCHSRCKPPVILKEYGFELRLMMLTCITCMNQLNTTNNGGSRLLQEDEETETPRTKQATKSLTLQLSNRNLLGDAWSGGKQIQR